MTDAPIRPALMPADTPDYMAHAWASCMQWAITSDNVLADFRADTGNNWTPATDRVSAAIDKACGADDAFCKAFIEWANVHVWGPVGIPAFLDADETSDAVLAP